MADFQASRRILALAATFFFITSVYLCTTRLYSMTFEREAHEKPEIVEEIINFKLGPADYGMSYGAYGRPALDGLTLIEELREELVPTVENGRRLLIIGDIHGMDDALRELLDAAKFDPERDHVIATGDMIDRGPDSPGVVSRLMKLGASAVRGNHEDRVLLTLSEADDPEGINKDLLTEDATKHRGEDKYLATGRRLTKEHVAWLSRLPVILNIEPLKMHVVHAGMVPGIKPEKQDPWAVMNMRALLYPREALRLNAANVDENPEDLDEAELDDAHLLTEEEIAAHDAFTDRDAAVPVDGHNGEKWADAWNRHQRRLKTPLRRTVVYGHDAKRGYREGRYSFGLDSGCVKGGALTALIVQGREGGGFTATTLQSLCKAP